MILIKQMNTIKQTCRKELTVNQVKAIMYAHTHQVDDKLIALSFSPSELRRLDLGKDDEFITINSEWMRRRYLDEIVDRVINLPKYDPPYINIIRRETWEECELKRTYDEDMRQVISYRTNQGVFKTLSFDMHIFIDPDEGMRQVTCYRTNNGKIVSKTLTVGWAHHVLGVVDETEEEEVSAYQLFKLAGMEIFHELANQMPMMDLIKLVK